MRVICEKWVALRMRVILQGLATAVINVYQSINKGPVSAASKEQQPTSAKQPV